MKHNSSAPDQFEPQAPNLVAAAVCIAAALTLLWPLLTGHILFGGARSDMFIAGYSFRLFGAETFRETGSIPQWNPYLLGGLPYIAAMHGDIFYPTAWLRWIMPVDLAITWGMAVHFVLAGWLTFRFARALGLSWGSAIFAGVAYELTGIVASQMSPGHDGKLFVSALTPLVFWTLLRAIRHQQRWAFGALAIEVALIVLGHYHMAYFLLIAMGLWALYLAFWDAEREPGHNPWSALALSTLAVVVGLGITGLQVIPFFEYIKYSPRAAGGPNTGWEFATSYAFPPSEVFTTILPQFNGVLDHYWGQNPIKFHTEYIGFLPLALMTLAFGDKSRRRLVIALSVLCVVFLF
ncbi:MAG: YfhO family protein, partial [Gemmatimonadaceae bacterium]